MKHIQVLLAGLATVTAHAEPICATVNPPPNDDTRWGDGTNGYLNVREKPNAKSKIIDQLRGYDVVCFDNDPLIDRFKGWSTSTT